MDNRGSVLGKCSRPPISGSVIYYYSISDSATPHIDAVQQQLMVCGMAR